MEDKNDKIIVFVEISKGSRQKYEYDEGLGGIKLDRTLYGPTVFPYDYGFIKDTQGQDGDPLDCILLSTFSTFPGCLVQARPIGLIEMEDEAGVDNKILALPLEKIDPFMAHIKDITNLPEFTLTHIKEFFETMKRLEPGKWVKLKGFRGKKEAEKIIEEAKKRKKEL